MMFIGFSMRHQGGEELIRKKSLHTRTELCANTWQVPSALLPPLGNHSPQKKKKKKINKHQIKQQQQQQR